MYQMLWTDWINGTIIKLLPKNVETKWTNCVTQDLQITKQCDYLIKWIKDATSRFCENWKEKTCSEIKCESACSKNLEQQGKDK